MSYIVFDPQIWSRHPFVSATKALAFLKPLDVDRSKLRIQIEQTREWIHYYDLEGRAAEEEEAARSNP